MGERITGIYGIENTVNGKWYVGQAVDIEERWYRHRLFLSENKHHNAVLQNSFNKHGADAFNFVVLEECNVDELDDKEKMWIIKKNSYLAGYNLTEGGEGTRGRICSDETRKKLSKWQQGEGAYWYGKTRSQEFRNKISEANRKRKYSKETRDKLRAASTGKHPSKEARDKMSKSQTGRRHSEETKRKISQSNIGKKMPPLSPERYQALMNASRAARMLKVRCIETDVVYDSAVIASESTGANYSNLCSCCKGKRKTAGGFHWEYAKEERR